MKNIDYTENGKYVILKEGNPRIAGYQWSNGDGVWVDGNPNSIGWTLTAYDVNGLIYRAPAPKEFMKLGWHSQNGSEWGVETYFIIFKELITEEYLNSLVSYYVNDTYEYAQILVDGWRAEEPDVSLTLFGESNIPTINSLLERIISNWDSKKSFIY